MGSMAGTTSANSAAVDRRQSEPEQTLHMDGGTQPFDGFTVKDFKKLCGTIKGHLEPVGDGQLEDVQVVKRIGKKKKPTLPASFDAHEAWPRCKSISTILDQGHCGSCWAFGALKSLSDRFCIHGLENVTLSENDVLACCGFECGYRCNGGYSYRAWQYFKRKGVVTDSCNPYFDTRTGDRNDE